MMLSSKVMLFTFCKWHLCRLNSFLRHEVQFGMHKTMICPTFNDSEHLPFTNVLEITSPNWSQTQ